MAEIVKESVTTTNVGPKAAVTTEVKRVASKAQRIEYVIYFLFGFLEILLMFRLLLKLAGASTSSAFVRFIYGMSGGFVLPFEGIFRKATTPGIETTAVLEPSTIVALLVYAVVSWGVVMLVRIFSGEPQEE